MYVQLPAADTWSCSLGRSRISAVPSPFPVCSEQPLAPHYAYGGVLSHPYGTDDFSHARTGEYLSIFSRVSGDYCTARNRQNPSYWSKLQLSNIFLPENCLSSVKVFSTLVRVLSSLLQCNFATYLAPQHRQLSTVILLSLSHSGTGQSREGQFPARYSSPPTEPSSEAPPLDSCLPARKVIQKPYWSSSQSPSHLQGLLHG